MRITITGSVGNISRPLIEQLVSANHQVQVITSSGDRVVEIERLGASAVVGHVDNADVLNFAFKQAEAVYLMIPPSYSTIHAIKHVGDMYAKAISECKVPVVVNLSGIGAHLPDGPGPSGANNYLEQLYNGLRGISFLHLRPGMFFTNFYGAIDLIKKQGIIGNNFDKNVVLALTHPRDIANVAFDAIHNKCINGNSARYVVSDKASGAQIATALGNAIGLPSLQWVQFPDDEMFQSLLQQGLSPQMATTYIIDMGKALRDGTLLQQYLKDGADILGEISLEKFAAEFAGVYNQIN